MKTVKKVEVINLRTGASRVAHIKYNDEWEEYVVVFHKDGKFQKGADYHTDCKEDAISTAEVWTSQA